MTKISRVRALPALILALLGAISHAADSPKIKTMRLPGGGVQPQAAVDGAGVVHLIYLTGDPSKSDIFYMRSTDDGDSFSKPLRVNSQPGSAIAMGTVRGAHLALGGAGHVHVAWMGSGSAEPKAPGKMGPMLYARSIDGGASFQPQRNVIQTHPGLDGGGSIAADEKGNVYVAWHAPLVKGEGEPSRRLWLTHSKDDGTAFTPEVAITGEAGACGCCGLRIAAGPDGSLFALYRTAEQSINRNMTLVRIDPKSPRPQSQTVGKMQSGICAMSTSALTSAGGLGEVGAWETTGQIFWYFISARNHEIAPMAVPGTHGGRKHPALAVNPAGQILVVWTEGTGWNKGGSIAWQTYDKSGIVLQDGAGRADGLPAWGAPAAFSGRDGSFVIAY